MGQSLADIVAEIVRRQFDGDVVDSVTVQPDADRDGDPILRVTVVLNAEIADLDPHKFTGLARHVRPALVERHEGAFPIFRFITKRDHDRWRHEAA